MTSRRSLLRRLKLRYVLVVVLLLSGIIPLVLSGSLIVYQNREILQDAERDSLVRRAEALSRELDGDLAATRRQLAQLGAGLLAVPGSRSVRGRLREPWVGAYVDGVRKNADVLALGVLDVDGAGLLPQSLAAPDRQALDTAFRAALAQRRPVYLSGPTRAEGDPVAVLAVPVPEAKPRLVVEALFVFRPAGEIVSEASGGVGIILIDGEGRLLWSRGGSPERTRELLRSDVVRAFRKHPLTMATEYELRSGGKRQEILAQVSAVPESGWGVVVQKPASAAFEMVNRMVVNTVASTLVLVGMALFFAFVAARRVSEPIQRLAETSHEIAAGNFGRRVEVTGLGSELADLADDFNRMSGHVEGYVQQLRQAAQANRELFIGSLRAFAAAIDAKDPYTRGHSERVAAVSRTISRHLGLAEELQHKLWIAALLHDVGKIGVEDRILKKGGVLSPEEYEQMKLHTVIGAEILSPIEQLKDVLPAVRWHHESWNGRGYPDGLKGEQIPLIARVVAVADTFDAITTNRPYQQAYGLQFAVETITKLAGSRFDAKVVTAFLRAYEAGEVRSAAGRTGRGDTRVQEARAARS